MYLRMWIFRPAVFRWQMHMNTIHSVCIVVRTYLLLAYNHLAQNLHSNLSFRVSPTILPRETVFVRTMPWPFLCPPSLPNIHEIGAGIYYVLTLFLILKSLKNNKKFIRLGHQTMSIFQTPIDSTPLQYHVWTMSAAAWSSIMYFLTVLLLRISAKSISCQGWYAMRVSLFLLTYYYYY